jgi:hypothetical protein
MGLSLRPGPGGGGGSGVKLPAEPRLDFPGFLKRSGIAFNPVLPCGHHLGKRSFVDEDNFAFRRIGQAFVADVQRFSGQTVSQGAG